MIRVIIVFAFIAVVATGSAWIADRPGSVVFDWQGWRAESPLWVLMVFIILLITVIGIFNRLLRLILRGRLFSTTRREANRRRRGYLALTEGMAAVAAGDSSAAQKLARRAKSLLDEPQASLLLTAQAAQLSGNELIAEESFRAMLNHSETKFLGLRGLMAQALRNDERNIALDLARSAHKLRPKTPWVLTALIDLEASTGHWDAAQRAVEEAVRQRAISSTLGKRNTALIVYERALKSERNGRPREALSLSEKASSLAPDLAPLVALTARLLSAAGKARRASR